MSIDEKAEFIAAVEYGKHNDYVAPNMFAFTKAIETYETANAPSTNEPCDGYEGLKAEISEIIRVARDNPGDLIKFLKLNFPKECGLSEEEHKALLDSSDTEQKADPREEF